MIPKTIHYCWFGHNPKPRLVVKCMKSWKKHCAGFQMIEWNEDTFDIESAPKYVREAYEAKKWAFVTDYVRLYALYCYGGVYMDTDVEVIKPLDRFLQSKGFSGFEDGESVPTGIIASEQCNLLIKEWLREYEDKRFVLENGSMNLETNVVAITRTMRERGLKLNNTLQEIEGFVFYPKEYFCPKSYEDGRIYKTRNTYTIHHFAGSWKTDEERIEHSNNQKQIRRDKMLRPIKNAFRAVMGDSLYEKLKRKTKKQ